MNLLFQSIIYISLIWISSGVILDRIRRLTRSLRLPAFSFSLLLLGTLTSIPEFAVGVNSVVLQTPDISLGNLIGGQIILLLCVIPLLALSKRGLPLLYPLQPRTIAVIVVTIALPFLFLFDHTLTQFEGMLLIGAFLLFASIFCIDMYRQHARLRSLSVHTRPGGTTRIDLLLILTAIGALFLATNRIVHLVAYNATTLGIHPFFVSAVVISIGTNIPEIALAIRSIRSRQKVAALGDYFGSAATNTLIAGIVVLGSGTTQLEYDTHLLLIPLIGFGLFWWFAKTRRTLSWVEAGILIAVAAAFFGASAYQELFIGTLLHRD